MEQMHLGLFESTSPFMMVAGWAGGHQVFPGVLTSHMTGYHMVDGQQRKMLAAILAGEIIPSENFALRQLDVWARPPDHFFQADNRWALIGVSHGVDQPAAIQHQAGLVG